MRGKIESGTSLDAICWFDIEVAAALQAVFAPIGFRCPVYMFVMPLEALDLHDRSSKVGLDASYLQYILAVT